MIYDSRIEWFPCCVRMGTTASTQHQIIETPSTAVDRRRSVSNMLNNEIAGTQQEPKGCATLQRTQGDTMASNNGRKASHQTKEGTGLTEYSTDKSEKRKRLEKRLRSKLLALYVFRRPAVPTVSVQFESGNDKTGDCPPSDGNPAEKVRSLDILYHPSNNREDLQRFLRQRRQENNDCWDEIKAEEGEEESSRFSIQARKDSCKNSSRGLSPFPQRRLLGGTADIPDEDLCPSPLPEVETDSHCDICGDVAPFSVQCRVCVRIFHRCCLESSGRYNETDRLLLDRADTAEGWTCHHCDDLCMLLSASETAEMMYDFDCYDINRDESISLAEFIRFKQDQYRRLVDGEEMPEEEVDLVRAQFGRMDTDASLEIDWWEFVRFEARRYLARKDVTEILSLLTPKELASARRLYDAYIDGRSPGHTYLQGVFLDDCIHTWKDFLQDQALYILWSRPNRDHAIKI